MTTKVCRDCKQELPLDEFYLVRKNSTRRPECKNCNLAYQRSKYNPSRRKNQHLKYLYNISLDEYHTKLKEQNYVCDVCEIDVPGGNGKNFYVDHNHKTGQVRGLLCHHCNMLIGHAKENINILMATIKYLQKWEVFQSQR